MRCRSQHSALTGVCLLCLTPADVKLFVLADDLIAKARAARQPKAAPAPVEQAEASPEADLMPAAGSNAPLREIVAAADDQSTSAPIDPEARGNNR